MKLLERDRLANSSDEVKRTIDIVWNAYRSILSAEGQLAYVSTAITSGRRMYDLMDQLGIRDAEELKTKEPTVFLDRIIKPNIEEGTALAKKIAQKIGNPVIAPSIFEARKQRWSQDEYMAMWLKMIEENVGLIYMAPGWEYSGGGAEEYLHAVQMALGFKKRWNIDIFDAEGQPLYFHRGLEILVKALSDLSQKKRKSKTLAEVINGLVTLWSTLHTHGIGDDLPSDWNRNYLNNAETPIIGQTLKNLLSNYGFNHDRGTIILGGSDSGLPPRKTDITPENIILKTEDPEIMENDKH